MSLDSPKASANQSTEEERFEDVREEDVLPRKKLKSLDKEESEDRVLDCGKYEVASDILCDSLSKGEERVEDVPDEEESGVVVVQMKWKTPMEKERSRQGRKRQLEEYRKREAVLERQERYLKRCRGVEACDSGANSPSALPQPRVSTDTSPNKHVRWKRDTSLVVEHEMPAEEDDDNTDCDPCEQPSNNGSGSSP